MSPTVDRSPVRPLVGDVAQVLFGPWPIRPLLLVVILAMVFQYSATDIDSTARLDAGAMLASIPVAVLRAAAVALPMWALLSLWRWWNGRAELTRSVYLGITLVTALNAASIRFWLSGGDLLADPQLYVAFVARAFLMLIVLQTVFGLADARLRAHVRRADAAVAEVEWQRRIVLESEERARSQVSQFLHDRVQAELVAVGLRLRAVEMASPSQLATDLSEIRDSVESIRRDGIRHASTTLSPDLHSVGLTTALQRLADGYAPAMQVTVTCGESFGTVDEDRLLGIYRIVEQALLNAAVHGHATSVTVIVTFSDADIHVSVEDDGEGCDPEHLTRGTGTALMDAWCGRYAGSWQMSSAQGSGTRIEASMSRMSASGSHL